jgi:hypothetical protein
MSPNYRNFGDTGQTDREPERVKPVVEKTEGDVFPYRGIENHGVKPHAKVPEYVDQWPDSQGDGEHYIPGPTEDEPIPVRIVQGDYTREYQDFRTFTAYVPNTSGQALNQSGLIIGRQDPGSASRRVVHIQNQSGTRAIFIGSDNGVSALNGYRVAANSEISFPLVTESEIWGASDDGSQVAVGVLVEFTIEV